MNRQYVMGALLVLGSFACGPEDQPVDDDAFTPPERPERALPAIDLPPESSDGPDFQDPDYEEFGDPAPGEETACCETEFALPDEEQTDDEVSAVLIGNAAPLDVEGGLPLTYSNGAWRATACVPPTFKGEYQYVVSIADDEGDVVYQEVRVSPNVPSGYSDIGEVNLWEPAEDRKSVV